MFELIYAFFEKKLKIFRQYLKKNEKKNSLKNLIYRLNIRFFLRLKKMNYFVYMSIIEN